jgi:hypothetical protein
MHSDWDPKTGNEYDDEESAEYEDYENDYETWCDYFSDELATLYHSLKDHAAAMGLPMMEHMDMSAFCHFAFKYSSGRKPFV